MPASGVEVRGRPRHGPVRVLELDLEPVRVAVLAPGLALDGRSDDRRRAAVARDLGEQVLGLLLELGLERLGDLRRIQVPSAATGDESGGDEEPDAQGAIRPDGIPPEFSGIHHGAGDASHRRPKLPAFTASGGAVPFGGNSDEGLRGWMMCSGDGGLLSPGSPSGSPALRVGDCPPPPSGARLQAVARRRPRRAAAAVAGRRPDAVCTSGVPRVRRPGRPSCVPGPMRPGFLLHMRPETLARSPRATGNHGRPGRVGSRGPPRSAGAMLRVGSGDRAPGASARVAYQSPRACLGGTAGVDSLVAGPQWVDEPAVRSAITSRLAALDAASTAWRMWLANVVRWRSAGEDAAPGATKTQSPGPAETPEPTAAAPAPSMRARRSRLAAGYRSAIVTRVGAVNAASSGAAASRIEAGSQA